MDYWKTNLKSTIGREKTFANKMYYEFLELRASLKAILS